MADRHASGAAGPDPAVEFSGAFDTIPGVSLTTQIVAALILLVLIVVALASVRHVPVAQRHVVNRMGRFHRTMRPGWHLLIPFVDRVSEKVSMGGRVLEVLFADLQTADDQMVSAKGLLYFQVLDARKAAGRLSTLNEAATGLTEKGLRQLVQELSVETLLHRTSREINGWLVGMLNQSAEEWGVRITRVELEFQS